MTFHRRMLLVGTDLPFAQVIQTHLHKTFLVNAPQVRFDDLPKVVRRDTDGVLLLLASDAHDADRIETAVRELRLQHLPPRLAVLATETFPAAKRIEPLSTFLEANLTWPGHTGRSRTARPSPTRPRRRRPTASAPACSPSPPAWPRSPSSWRSPPRTT
jgi:hypothetical protein